MEFIFWVVFYIAIISVIGFIYGFVSEFMRLWRDDIRDKKNRNIKQIRTEWKKK